MQPFLARVFAAIGVFAGTNVDDLVVLTVLFLACRATGRPRAWQIWAGQFLGIAILVAVSAAGALGLQIVPDRWVALLGLVPLVLGMRGIYLAWRGDADEDEAPTARGLVAVVGLTMANGADNLAVYTPLLRTLGRVDTLVTLGVFAVGVGVWCGTASVLGSHPRVIAVVDRYGRWLVPAVFVVLGASMVVGGFGG